MVLKVSFNFGDISSESVGQSTRDFSLLANPSVVDGTMGIEAAKVLLIETTIPLNKLETAKSSVLAPVNCKSRNSILNVTEETYNSKHLENLSRF